MTQKRLRVSLPGHAVGALAQDRAGATRWSPEAAWESGGQLPRLGLDFLRAPGPRGDANDVPAWFSNLLPERGSALRDRFAAQFGLREGQSFELLRALGRDLVGAVEARAELDADASEGAELPEGAGRDDAARVAPSALTGNQLKLAMSMEGERLVFSARASDRHYIVKFAGIEHPELAEVEDATMTWAERAGFAVPEHFTAPPTRLVGVPAGWLASDAPVYAVRRFDRRADGTKIHQEDLCQALNLRPRNKYGDGLAARVSTEGALRLVVDACGEDDGRELARRIGFVIASGNTDAHLKNWSLQWGEATRPALTPAYDLVCTVAWERYGWARPGGPTLALALGGSAWLRDLDAGRLAQAAQRAGLPWLPSEVIAGVDRAREARPSVAMPERMRVALVVHGERVPLLAARGGL